MKILIVYDSFFGNTEKIALEIGAALGAGLAERGEVETIKISQATPEKVGGLDLLIVGSPTRGFRPTEATSKFLNSLAKDQLDGLGVAAFDTRIALETIDSAVFRLVVDKGGYAASTIAKALKKKGGNLLAPPEGFLVTGEQGPLKDGELERAKEWAGQLLSLVLGKING
jgi:flavodoxin